ncbi:MAG: leucine-rich repeat domain-containing protein [Verrucomicrobia bacterium]|nr:leucine-rich repeat domain-containing protein [Verrucomicrobiota bacterium]
MNAINLRISKIRYSAAEAAVSSSSAQASDKVQEVANNCFTFAALPNELQIHVLSFFDLRELANFSVTSCDANEHALDRQIWTGIAKRINCPIDKSVDSRTQVLNFITCIQRRAQTIHPLPREIADILRRPTIDQINMIQDWLQARQTLENWRQLTEKINLEFPLLNFPGPGEIANLKIAEMIAKAREYRQHLELFKARDTLVVWRHLAAATGLQDPNLAELVTDAEIINRSKAFDAWFAMNRNVLGELTDLHLGSNLLTSIPIQIGQLSNLLLLGLSSNLLTAIPNQIWQLTNLQCLPLSNNQLTSVPPQVGQLTNLQMLNLSMNHLTSIPKEIGQLTNLQTLDLSMNYLTSIPKEIGQLTNLQKLNLFMNHLTSIPKEIGQLTNLQTLYLSINYLTSIPPQIGQLTNLQNLHLTNNFLTSIPSEIGHLNNLQLLELQHNQLRSVPSQIGMLDNLRGLDLSSNQLTVIPFALLLKQMNLNVTNNPLSSLRRAIFLHTNEVAIVTSTVALTLFGLYYYPSSIPNAISYLRGLYERLELITSCMPRDQWPKHILREIFGRYVFSI